MKPSFLKLCCIKIKILDACASEKIGEFSVPATTLTSVHGILFRLLAALRDTHLIESKRSIKIDGKSANCLA